MSDDAERLSFWEWIRLPQAIIALAAIVLSVCGLFIALYEAAIIRQAQRASVWPHVEVGASLTTGRVSLTVKNVGVGPARIRAAALLYDGELMSGWAEALGRIGAQGDHVRFTRSYINGRVLAVQGMDALFVHTPRESDVQALEGVRSSGRPLSRKSSTSRSATARSTTSAGSPACTTSSGAGTTPRIPPPRERSTTATASPAVRSRSV